MKYYLNNLKHIIENRMSITCARVQKKAQLKGKCAHGTFL
jgi:hypothetical protein